MRAGWKREGRRGEGGADGRGRGEWESEG
jgi:hypothetical protein